MEIAYTPPFSVYQPAPKINGSIEEKTKLSPELYKKLIHNQDMLTGNLHGDMSAGETALFGLSTISMAASAYHGYKRNESIGWALVWGFFGGLCPVIVPVIAYGQGFGKPNPHTLAHEHDYANAHR